MAEPNRIEVPRNTEARDILDAGKALVKVQKNPHQHGRDFIVLGGPLGDRTEYLERPEAPPRAVGTVNVADAASFIIATNRYLRTENTVLYASLHPAAFVAVLNDHRGAGILEGANWRDHRVAFTLAQSKECLAWHGKQKNAFTQESFAMWIEDQLPDFRDPSGARMLEIALNFKVNRKVALKSAINLSDGTTQLEYAETNTDGGLGPAKKLAMPEAFTIEIPVWSGLEQKKYAFAARLRYRVDGPSLAISYELIRSHRVIEQAFADVLAEIKKGIKGVPVIFGSAD